MKRLYNHLSVDSINDRKGHVIAVSFNTIAKSVFIYLGIPFLAGFITRFLLIKYKGSFWDEIVFLPKLPLLQLSAITTNLLCKKL